MLKLVFAVLFAVIALNEANNYQYNYNQQNVRQLSSKSSGYGGYGSSSVQMPKPMITLPKVPSLPKVPTLPKVPALPRQPQYQSYQPPATTQTPPPPPPPATQPPVEYQSYEAPEPEPVPVPVPAPVERVFTPVKQPQYQSYQQPSIPSIPSIPVVPKMDKIPKQSSYSSYGSSLTSVPTAPSNPCIGRVPEEKLADPSNPSQFIVCLEEEQFTIMQCPLSLVFNPNTLRCENTLRLVRACASNPCQNDGICTDLAAGQFRCDCQPRWTGDFCEKLDVCPPNACGPSGVCIPLAQGSPLPKFCLCNGGQSFGTDCNVVESNPCLTNDAELQNFPTKTNPAIFAHCEGNIPHLKFCLYPLVYSHELQRCDWTQSPGPVGSSSSSGYGY